MSLEPKERLDKFDVRISLPSHAIFVGATLSGKTTLALSLLTKPHLFNPPPKQVFFYYDHFQEAYSEAKAALACNGIKLHLIKGFPDINLESFPQSADQTIILIDDFSEETSSSSNIARVATQGRHKNISIWLIWHSLYSKHAASRVICQSVRWFFFLPSLRLQSQLRSFGAQMGIKGRLLYAFKRCQEEESRDCRYIVVDSGPETPDIMRVRSSIHNHELQYAYK